MGMRRIADVTRAECPTELESILATFVDMWGMESILNGLHNLAIDKGAACSNPHLTPCWTRVKTGLAEVALLVPCESGDN